MVLLFTCCSEHLMDSSNSKDSFPSCGEDSSIISLVTPPSCFHSFFQELNHINCFYMYLLSFLELPCWPRCKASACNVGDQIQSLGQEDALEKEMAIHSSTLAWKIPWTEEPGRLQSMWLQRVEHD